jgi:CRISPR-associated exonuclease Cas4
LIHIEQAWSENIFTAQGRILHEKAHSQSAESRKNERTEYGMPLRSLEWGLIGKADVVEFHLREDKWHPFAVEYKRGRPKPDNRDKVQLCAQAMCLEEMLSVSIGQGALYYGKERHRTVVDFNEDLRRETKETIHRLRRLFELGCTPPPVYEAKCDSCSLFEICMPKTMGKHKSVADYLAESIRQA